MHKKLAADLTSLAHSILQMKNKEDVFALKTKAHEVYEKLAVLAYVEEYLNNTPNPEHTKEELLDLIKKADERLENETEIENIEDVISSSTESVIEDFISKTEDEEEPEEQQLADSEDDDAKIIKEESPSEDIELTIEETSHIPDSIEESDDLFSQSEEILEKVDEEVLEIDEVSEEETIPSLEDELKDTIAADVVADLFENAPKKSLNDKIRDDIQIGLNDRIAFVKNLFDGSQEDFNRVVSQLNSFKTEKEAKKFINKMVKPDYNWADNEEIEERFMTIVERKFL
jgi:hypothetical protein